jgi:hypothetical protein
MPAHSRHRAFRKGWRHNSVLPVGQQRIQSLRLGGKAVSARCQAAKKQLQQSEKGAKFNQGKPVNFKF